MAGVYKGLTIRIGADDTDLQNALDQNAREARRLQGELKKIEKGLAFDTRSPEMLAAKIQKVSEQSDKTKQRLELLLQAERDIGQGEMRTDQWVRLQGEIAECEERIKAYDKQVRELGSQQAAADSLLGKAGGFLSDHAEGFERVGGAMQSAGRTLSHTLTPAIVAGAGASVAAAVDIDTSLTNVRKTLEASDEEYQQLKDAAVEFSKTNAVSASQILDIEALGAQLGYSLDVMSNGKTEVQEFGEVVAGLDIATNMSAEQAGTELAQFANITKMSKEDTERYGSTIVGLGNNFATTESDISSMAMRIAAAGTQVGMSQADILGLATSLSSLGIEAEAGGTAISTIMSEIDKSVATGSSSLETWASAANMSADEFAAAWQNDPVSALSAVLSGLEEASGEGSNMAIMLDELGISSLRQTDVMKRLAGNSELTAEAVARANDEWEKNDALSNEVANRNDSLAAKFEILKNRITAIAEQVGKPLVDAMLGAVEAAEPLIKAIEDGARKFSEMSRDEQEAVLKTVAFAAALGPALSGVGGLIQKIGPLGEGMESLAKGLAKADMKVFGTAAASASTAAGAAAAGGIAALVVALGGAAIGIANTVKEANDYRDATEGLVQAAESVSGSVSGNVGAFEQAAEASENTRERVKAALEDQAQAARDLNDDMAEIGKDSALLDDYVAKIQDLAGKCDGDATRLAELKLAVEGYNSITGESISIIDDQSGAIDRSTGALEANAKAWEARAYAQAIEEKMTELAKIQIDNEQNLADAEEKRADALAELNRVKEETPWDNDAILAATMSYQSFDEQVNEARAALEANDVAMEQLKGRYTELSEEQARNQEQAAAWEEGYNRLREGLQNAGVDAETTTAMLAGLDAQGINPKEFSVTDNGTIIDNMGRVLDLNAQTLDGKPYTVTDNGSIQVEMSKMDEIAGKDVPDEDFTVSLEDAASGPLDQIDGKADDVAQDRDFSVSAVDKASDILEGIWGWLSGLGDRTINIGAVRLATGGVSIPRHMAGAIVTRATLTPDGIVGEAGDEAILQGPGGSRGIFPLSNRRHVRPFAQAVAAEMPDRGGDTSALAAQIAALRSDVRGLSLTVALDGKKVAGAIYPHISESAAADSRRADGRIY